MRRHVITLKEDSFRHVVGQLQKKIEATGFVPDAVLSIRRGGEFVGEQMFPGKPHYAVTLQRESTKRKKGILKNVFRIMPRFLLDRMRILEAWLLSHSSHKAVLSANVILPDLNPHRSILIVDDAVDSGATLASVFNVARTQFLHTDFKTAAITVTTEKPLINPDFSIYNNLTLIRFPWSIDN